MSTIGAYPQLVDQLDGLRRQWRIAKVIEGSLLAVAGGAAVLIALVAADNIFQLGLFGRFLMACILWGGLGTLIFALVVQRWLEDRREDFFAVLVEKKHPELHNRLINALQLGRGAEYGSKEIISAIVSDASTATVDLEMEDCLDWTPVKRAAIGTGVAVLLFIGYAVLFAPRFANGLGRVLLPIANIDPYRATEIDEDSIKPADGKRFPEGAAVEVSVRVGGDTVPESATLFRSTDGKTWRPVLMRTDRRKTQDGTASFRFVAAEAAESFQFYIAAGDDRTKPRGVEIVQRPRVENVGVTYQFPSYTEREAQTVAESSGEIAALAGTRINLAVTTSKPIKEAALETESGEIIDLTGSTGDKSWTGGFVVWSEEATGENEVNDFVITAPTRFRIRLIDTDGYENAAPLWSAITLIKDQAPSVSIPIPGRDDQVKIEDKVKLNVESRDDYGLSDVRLVYRVNDDTAASEVTRFPHAGKPKSKAVDEFEWNLAESGIKPGDVVQYWATVVDRNNITGPGEASSRRFSIFVITPEQILAKMELQMDDYAAVLEELIRLQRENRAQSASGVEFETLVLRQTKIRTNTAVLARAMKKGALPVASMVGTLNELYAGLMADVIRLLESGRDTKDAARAGVVRNESLPVQDEIVKQLQDLLNRLQRNEQARKALRRIRKEDEASHKELSQALEKLVSDLDRLVVDETELMSKLEKMPKRPVDELGDEQLDPLKQFEEFHERWAKWRKGTIDELTKLPTGFIEDFNLRADVNSVFEEIEAVAQRPKTTKLEVALEDAGSSKATEMLEDLETWMPDAPDALQWVMEEPLDKRPMEMPEMPLPDALEDLIGELLQEADDFDDEADDITSAWGDNLNQAGWGVSDGPISNFSAKGKTGNDLPNKNEVSGRAGDGRRGKSSGQMVGDTARGLEGRKTPARLNNERYEEGKLKEEGRLDPNGATGGGKKAGAGRRGLQGGTPPDFLRDMERLSAKQAGMREKAEQVARQLDTTTVTGRRLNQAIELMKSVEDDLRDLRYEDAARKRKVAMQKLKATFNNLDRSTAVQLSQARELPAQLREELLQSADEGYPEGYESLLESYFRALSEAEK
ncbi:MAG: hypothetical protein CMJ64_10150 [Planctomycetaceae bacterium]|nr:hypothetical protein [Planctomycetaceae bacterium]